jgi:hypothetical protein
VKQLIKKILKEEISSKEAYSEFDSIKTVVDGKRNIAFTTLDSPKSKIYVFLNGLKKIKVPSDDAVNYIIYRDGSEEMANELLQIANKYGGKLHYDANEEDSRRIGQILNYHPNEIEDYIRHNKNIKGNVNESKFFRRRVPLQKVENLLRDYAYEMYHETESYSQFKYELTLKAVEWIMWDEYKMGWDELPEQEEIDFVTEVSNILEDKIKPLYNYYNKK